MLLLTLMTVGAVILAGTVWSYGKLDHDNKELYVEGLEDSMAR